MKAQQIFNKVKNHLLKQNKKAIYNGNCAYKHDGMSCAIGCLIPDDVYLPEMEGYSIGALVNLFDLPEYLLDNFHLLIELQKIHDESNPKMWKKELTQLANKQHLNSAR